MDPHARKVSENIPDNARENTNWPRKYSPLWTFSRMGTWAKEDTAVSIKIPFYLFLRCGVKQRNLRLGGRKVAFLEAQAGPTAKFFKQCGGKLVGEMALRGACGRAYLQGNFAKWMDIMGRYGKIPQCPTERRGRGPIDTQREGEPPPKTPCQSGPTPCQSVRSSNGKP